MRPPVPPFTEETARQKVQAAEDAWNTRDPERVAAAYSEDSQWRRSAHGASVHSWSGSLATAHARTGPAMTLR